MKARAIHPAGEGALLVEFGEGIDEAALASVSALDAALAREPFQGLLETVPAYRSLLVEFDPLFVGMGEARGAILRLLRGLWPRKREEARVVEIPLAYGGGSGPDLAFVAASNGLSEEEVVRIHVSGDYRVHMVGFTPGFPYLGGMDGRIAAPRLPSPRARVPAGSVGIAGGQTGIYPFESPGGWRLIGRSPTRLFDPERDPPALLQAGDRVRFTAISEAECLRLEEEARGQDREARLTSAPRRGRVEVLAGGLSTTVQDLGRRGHKRHGVPASGAMDGFAARMANALVGNDEGAALLEATLSGPRLRFAEATTIAITGADLGPRVDGYPAAMWRSLFVGPGSLLEFEGPGWGCRAYIAFAGGIDVEPVLGSRSTYQRGGFGGLGGRRLASGDLLGLLPAAPPAPPVIRTLGREFLPSRGAPVLLRAVRGPQDGSFEGEALRLFFSREYRVGAEADRMGYRLEGPALRHRRSADIVSDGTAAGSVQVPGNGLPIVTLADRQTTGGYAKIATVVGADLDLFAQLLPGDRLGFREVSPEGGRAAWRAHAARLEAARRSVAASAVEVVRSRRFALRVDGRSFDALVEEEGGSPRGPQ